MTVSTELTAAQKKEVTMKFFWFGNAIPIIIPMFVLALYDNFYVIFELNGLTYFGLIGFPLIVSVAAHLYDDNKYKFFTIKRVDYILYFIAILTMSLIAYQVNNTGGFDNSILIFYFYFIPSAIAISFKAKIGLILTLILSFGSIAYNYWSKPIITDEISLSNFSSAEYKIFYLLIIAIHLASLGLLEYQNDKKNENV